MCGARAGAPWAAPLRLPQNPRLLFDGTMGFSIAAIKAQISTPPACHRHGKEIVCVGSALEDLEWPEAVAASLFSLLLTASLPTQWACRLLSDSGKALKRRKLCLHCAEGVGFCFLMPMEAFRLCAPKEAVGLLWDVSWPSFSPLAILCTDHAIKEATRPPARNTIPVHTDSSLFCHCITGPL